MPEPDRVWAPKAGEPVIGRVAGMESPVHSELHLTPSDISCAVTGTEHSCEPVEVAV
jgi:hypothetical protein